MLKRCYFSQFRTNPIAELVLGQCDCKESKRRRYNKQKLKTKEEKTEEEEETKNEYELAEGWTKETGRHWG